MKIPLDFSFDTHFVYVDQCHKNTLNIVVRALVDYHLPADTMEKAVQFLVRKHPYLSAVVVYHESDFCLSPFMLETVDVDHLGFSVRDVEIGELERVMKHPSPWREHRFDIFNVGLAHIDVLRDGDNSIVELVCAHLIGDVTAVVMLFSDLLRFLEQAIDGESPLDARQARHIYDETRYGWKENIDAVHALALPEGVIVNDALWPRPPSQYARGHIPSKMIGDIKDWLARNAINGKVTDVFYYVIEQLCVRKYRIDMKYSAVFSFRNLFEDVNDVVNINSSAIFAELAVQKELLDSPKKWIENCNAVRSQAITREGVMGMMHFLRSLNLAMRGKTTEERRRLINACVPINSFFAINNFGRLDKHFPALKQFRIIDIDIQDGVPTQEVRIFGYRDVLHINPMLSAGGTVSAETLCEDFVAMLQQLIEE